MIQNDYGSGDAEKMMGKLEGLEAKITALSRSQADLKEFAYTAAHDLKEPLRKFNVFSEKLRIKYKNILDEEGNLYIDRMMFAANTMRKLVESLMNFLSLNEEREYFRKTDLNEVLKSVKHDLALQIEDSGLSLKSAILPVIEAVPAQMKQLFTELLSNAIKFSKSGVTPEILINCAPADKSDLISKGLQPETQYLRMEVRDNGIGFESEYSRQIFKVFQRLHGNAVYPGSGVGLAICKRILDIHHGIIYAESRLGIGSTFVFFIPQKDKS